MKFGVQVTGLDELMIRLNRVSKAVSDGSARALRELGYDVIKGSIQRAPEKTGKLVDSHRLATENRGRYITHVSVTVGPVYDEKGDEYSFLMHEGFISIKNMEDWPYKLGFDSEAKNLGIEHRGEGVGYKFLERSYRAVYRDALHRVNKRVWNDIKIAVGR